MSLNPNFDELETLLDPGLPEEFELRVPDEWVLGTLKAGLFWNKKKLSETLTKFQLEISGHKITVVADSDPDMGIPSVH